MTRIGAAVDRDRRTSRPPVPPAASTWANLRTAPLAWLFAPLTDERRRRCGGRHDDTSRFDGGKRSLPSRRDRDRRAVAATRRWRTACCPRHSTSQV